MDSKGGPSLRGLLMFTFALALLFFAAEGSYFATASLSPRAPVVVPRPDSYHLMIFEPMNSEWNSTMAQPKFDVMNPDGLSSSADITVPVDTLIQLIIVSYDSPTPGNPDQSGVVTGTVGGNIFMINGTAASMGDSPLDWGMNMSSVPDSDLAHTFTIPELGVNIPVVGGDTTVAYVKFTRTGTFTWICVTPCGFGPTGMDGAMSASGWMMGQLTVK